MKINENNKRIIDQVEISILENEPKLNIFNYMNSNNKLRFEN